MPPSIRVFVSNRADLSFELQCSFSQATVLIGRKHDADLELPFPYVSSRQAELHFAPQGHWVLRDLNAHNPMMMGDSPVDRGGEVRLQPGVRVGLGPLELRFEFDSCHSGEIEDGYHDRELEAYKALPALRKLHSVLGVARREWESALVDLVEVDSDEATRQRVFQLLDREFPDSDWAPIFRRDTLLIDDPLHASLAVHLSELAPSLPTPATAQDAERALTCVITALRTFATSALDLQRSLQRQLSTLGSSLQDPQSVLARQTRDDLLAHLLDWRHHTSADTRQLDTAMSAQIKELDLILDASLAAMHELLSAVSPVTIERSTDGRWPTRATALWNAYLASFSALVGDDRSNISPAFREIFTEALNRARRKSRLYSSGDQP